MRISRLCFEEYDEDDIMFIPNDCGREVKVSETEDLRNALRKTSRRLRKLANSIDELIELL